MKDCFSFRFFEPGETKRKSLFIFFSSEASIDSVSRAIKLDVSINLPAKNVFVASLCDSPPSTKIYTEDQSFSSEFESYIGRIDTQLHCLGVKPCGAIVHGEATIDSNLRESILKSGMLILFEKHRGVITSSNGYHFIKPSGDHCDKFIRASNLLVSSVEVTFLAVALLPFIANDLKYVYVDTSSISYLVSVALQTSKKYTNQLPAVESFESYSIVDRKYDFVESTSSLVLISATTSGSLAKTIKDHSSFSYDQILTIFHLGLPEGQRGVFDVSAAIPRGIASKKASDCALCKSGAKAIRISGDQFLPDSPKHELLVIRKSDFSRERGDFFKEFATQNVLAWNTASTINAASREHFYIAADQAISTAPVRFMADLEKVIRRRVTRDLKVVVYFQDPGSESIAHKVREYLGAEADTISWVRFNDLNEDNISGKRSVMVIAGAITSGRSLLAASRKLRCIASSSSINYLVAFSKVPTEEAFDQLRKDLCLGGNELTVIRKCPVPRIKEYTKTAWDWERDYLSRFDGGDPLSANNTPAPGMLSERSLSLSRFENDPDSLFLPKPSGEPLKLRNTFAFWSDLGLESRTDSATQADVYWTIQVVLHDLRLASDEKGLASTYHTTLISPACFDRYNDGVIQASLLRSALPVEIDYRVDSAYSRQMTDVIISVVDNFGSDQGEASLEFLLALLSKRLRINEDHLQEVLTLRRNQMPEEMLFLIDELSQRLRETGQD